mmetsp:Transcript_10465/g.32201  ORF Transcript_10465/g.32201 Transcript_10465/m.32201 type:complete len:706 (-) Transcript_10465:171-2288(-)|eukprot:CAMPEP_0174230690 /NCGR_PEP_ID=MMETSP0417-20130205/1393_1 /TAXON_ID=242541 /ORGANISM="Mayorella sp, Strain BSH-02190019" /LENGTH=705 /DNA_ID=CAMNT_0015308429 /DNA_START=172 /DNA_END=2289 /DNA_ORIENTATION=+
MFIESIRRPSRRRPDLFPVVCLPVLILVAQFAWSGATLRAVLVHDQPVSQYGFYLELSESRVSAGRLTNISFEVHPDLRLDQWDTVFERLVDEFDLIVPELLASGIDRELEFVSRHPERAFMLLSLAKRIENTPHVRYLAGLIERNVWAMGCLAALTGRHACLLSNPELPSTFPNSFFLGASVCSPGTPVSVALRPNASPTDTQSEARQDEFTRHAVAELSARGCETAFYMVGDSLGHQLFHQAGILTMGLASDYSTLFGESVLTSLLTDFQEPFVQAIEDYRSGLWFDLESMPRAIAFYGDRLAPYSVLVSPAVRERMRSELLRVGSGSRGWTHIWCDAPGNGTLLVPILPPGVELDQEWCVPPASVPRMYSAPLHPGIDSLGLLTIDDQEVAELPFGWRVFLYTCVSICLLLLLVLMMALVTLRHRAVIHYASLGFCLSMLLGAVLLTSSILVWVPPLELASCHIMVWLAALGATLMVGSLLVKSFRLAVLARAQKTLVGKVVVPVDNLHLAFTLAVLCALTISLLIVYSVAGVEMDHIYVDLFEYREACQLTTVGIVFASLLVGWNALLLVGCCVCSFKARSLPVLFDESTSILLSTYSMVFALLVVVPLFVLLDDYSTQVVITALGVLVFSFGTACLVMFPKTYVIFCGLNGSESTDKYILQSKPSARPHSNDNPALSSEPSMPRPDLMSIPTFTTEVDAA